MTKLILTALICASTTMYMQAQIFINTGNPNLDKYKKENPNAVIWNEGNNIPIPANTPVEPTEKPKPEPKKQESAKPAATEKTVEPTIQKTAPTPVATQNNAAGDYPPNAIPGKCYARCTAPDQYEYKEETVVDKPATFKIEKIPARYETVFDTVVVKPASTKTVTIPAQYQTVKEQQLVSPAKQEWVKGKADVNCLSQNPKDCEVWCLKEIPAVYKAVEKKLEVAPAITKEEVVAAVTKVVPRKKLIEPARENKTEVPATYKTVMNKILVKKGGYQEWKEVMCEQDVTDNKVKQIQEALKREGYDPGPIDNVMGGKTKEALAKFQQDKGLPQGNLNIETLNALGVK